MNSDTFEKLLREAEPAGQLPPPADLADRVRHRAARRDRRARNLRRGIAAGVIALVAITFAIRSSFDSPNTQPIADAVATVTSESPPLSPTEIARLRDEAAEFQAQADSLERQLGVIRTRLAREQVRDEYARSLAAAANDVATSAVDRAASIGVCQGDFMWQVREAREEARQAYESVVDHFPNSHWATVARERLTQLQMN